MKVQRESSTPAFGIGNRFGQHMLIKTDAPSPQRYSVPSLDFTNDNTTGSQGKGFQFGISREKYEKVYIKEHMR